MDILAAKPELIALACGLPEARVLARAGYIANVVAIARTNSLKSGLGANLSSTIHCVLCNPFAGTS